MLGRCATCSHWRPFDPNGTEKYTDGTVKASRLGLCGKVTGVRSFERWDEDGDPPCTYVETTAAVEDLSDCCALRTAAEFGCVLWEAKS
jgi:hypothetical protein